MEKSDSDALNGTPGSPRKCLFSFVNATRLWLFNKVTAVFLQLGKQQLRPKE
jgi:hypothetical protein